jgi:hypothetical protein
MNRLKILASLLPFVLLTSCHQGSDTSPNNGGGSTVTWTIPSVRAKYVFQSSTPGLTKTVLDTSIIVTTGQHLGGKTNVITYEDLAGTIGTAFYNIEDNGDISDGDAALGDTTFTWTTFPTASHQPISDPVTDTTEGGIHIFRSNVCTYVGGETLTTLAGSFSTLHVRETSISIVTGPDSLDCNARDTSILDRWYAPTIGLYVKVTNNGTNDGQPFDQSEVDLVKYLPK